VKFMLDTNTLIYLIKNKPASVAERMNALGEDDAVCMSFVTYAELLKGAEGSVRKAEVQRRLEGLVRQVPVLHPTSAGICEHYAVQAARLKSRGTPIGGNDLWIAAHALAEGAVLVTNNEAEFGRIEGLRVENWVA
jgi:tRNA(fMet)-specific endonuclease VapC